MNTKLHAITDTNGRPIRFFMSAGQISEHGKIIKEAETESEPDFGVLSP